MSRRKPRPRRLPASLPKVEDEDSSSIRIIVGICVLLFVFAGWLRYSIFGWGGPIITEEHYNRPVVLRRFPLPARKLPQGFTAGSVKEPGYQIFDDPAAIRSEIHRFELPSADAERLLVAEYKSSTDDRFVLLALEFETNEAAKAYSTAFHSQDATALVLAGPDNPAASVLEDTLRTRAEREKKTRIQLEKAKTAGNAILCFIMDMLVGALFFALCLSLAKYFLIFRQVEQ